jgi:RecA/RadA recombinase
MERASGVETAGEAAKRVGSFPFLGSGSKKLDLLLRGGYRCGTLTEVFGRSNSGKSQLAMQAALMAAKSGVSSLYIDTEGSFRPERLEQMAVGRGWETQSLLNKIVYVRSDSAAEQMETVRRMQGRSATASCRLVIVDTITRNFSVELPGSTNLVSRQEAVAVHLSEMARDAYVNGRAYVLCNRVTFGPTRDVSIGGRTVEQMVNTSIMLERSGIVVKATKVEKGEFEELEITASGVA